VRHRYELMLIVIGDYADEVSAHLQEHGAVLDRVTIRRFLRGPPMRAIRTGLVRNGHPAKLSSTTHRQCKRYFVIVINSSRPYRCTLCLVRRPLRRYWDMGHCDLAREANLVRLKKQKSTACHEDVGMVIGWTRFN